MPSFPPDSAHNRRRSSASATASNSVRNSLVSSRSSRNTARYSEGISPFHSGDGRFLGLVRFLLLKFIVALSCDLVHLLVYKFTLCQPVAGLARFRWCSFFISLISFICFFNFLFSKKRRGDSLRLAGIL